MRRRLAPLLVVAGGVLLLVAGLQAFGGLPGAGDVAHPYGARAVAVALDQATANAVISVTFDQRGLDTLGEELILFAAATGTLLLLRRLGREAEEEVPHGYGPEDVFEALRLVGYLLLPVTALVGCYVVLHGTISPGGGFQGGAILATGLHLAYLAGDYRTLDRLRPPGMFDVAEAVGAFGYVAVGFSGLLTGAAFLANWLPHGTLGDVLSGGTLPVLNTVVGVEVGAAFVLVVAKFLEQALLVPEEEH